jgi:hypothetical protein
MSSSSRRHANNTQIYGAVFFNAYKSCSSESGDDGSWNRPVELRIEHSDHL